MKKVLVSVNDESKRYWLVSESDIDRNVCYLTGDEGLYGWDGKEMNSLSDCFISEGDYLMFFESVNEDLVDDFWPSDTENLIEKVKQGDFVEFAGEYYTPVDWVCYDDEIVTLEYDINSEDVLITSRSYDVFVDTINVDVEKIDYIPMNYPHQPHVNIYEGTDEDGKKIRITETSPIYAADHYPLSELEYIEE